MNIHGIDNDISNFAGSIPLNPMKHPSNEAQEKPAGIQGFFGSSVHMGSLLGVHQ